MAAPLFDAIVVGGGPAGSAVARLLSSWGHDVLVLARPTDPRRGLAESLPPSSRKLLSAIGVLDAVEHAPFCRGTGNIVWWGDRVGDLEPYGGSDGGGFQVFRPDLDALLLSEARKAGAVVHGDAIVRGFDLGDDCASVEFVSGGESRSARGRFVVDASGRTGVIGRRFRRWEPGYGMQALIGVWERSGGWGLPDESYTCVEMHQDGWAWSIPVRPGTRHLVVMVDGRVSDLPRAATLERTYVAALGKTAQMDRLREGARLQRVWACDASLYSASSYAGPRFMLVGDAGSAIDPLSSFGVKKALGSAWIGAVALHTALVDSTLQAPAFDFFEAREREVYAAHLRHSAAYAREALARHPHPFWAVRANPIGESRVDTLDEVALTRSPDVQAAFAALRGRAGGRFMTASEPARRTVALIRGHRIVLEPAIALRGLAQPIRHFDGVDLLAICELAKDGCDVPTLSDRYARAVSPVALPSLLRSVSLLLARGALVSPAVPTT